MSPGNATYTCLQRGDVLYEPIPSQVNMLLVLRGERFGRNVLPKSRETILATSVEILLMPGILHITVSLGRLGETLCRAKLTV